MPTLKSNPLLLNNAALTKDQRISTLKRLQSGHKNIPDLSAVDVVICQQLDKFTEFNVEELNKYRFYSKKAEDTDDIISILDNQLLYVDIMENNIKEILSKRRKYIDKQKTRALEIIDAKKKDKLKSVRDAYKEADALAIIDKLPPDMVQYIITFLRPEIRVCVLREKYSNLADNIKRMRNGKAHQLRSAIQKSIEHHIGRYPPHFTGGKLVNPVYNAVKHIRETFQQRTQYNWNGYSNTDNTIIVAVQIQKALDNIYTIAEYVMNISTPEGKEPSTLSNPYNNKLMNSIIHMYCLVLYAANPPAQA